jgi:hypothetical protein
MEYSELEKNKFIEEFQKRRSKRVIIFIVALVFLLLVGFIAMPLMDYYGIQRQIWAPFIYLTMLAIIIAIAVIWRCPVCNGFLGDVFTTKYCSKCGFKFTDN